MRAKQSSDVIVLELEGQLDFETTQEMRQKCNELMRKFNTEQILFDFGKLKFVGSSGISLFIAVLKDLNKKKGCMKMCNLSIEFSKMFKAYQTTRRPFEIFETEEEAIQSFMNPAKKRIGQA